MITRKLLRQAHLTTLTVTTEMMIRNNEKKSVFFFIISKQLFSIVQTKAAAMLAVINKVCIIRES